MGGLTLGGVVSWYYLVDGVYDHKTSAAVERFYRKAGWDAHAAFMDSLAEEGTVILGGPVGEGDGEHSLLVVHSESEAAIRARLADDPWANGILAIDSVEPWSVWLRADVRC